MRLLAGSLEIPSDPSKMLMTFGKLPGAFGALRLVSCLSFEPEGVLHSFTGILRLMQAYQAFFF